MAFRQIVRQLQLLRGIGEWDRQPITKGNHEQWLETLESRLQDAKRSKREIEHLLKNLTLGLWPEFRKLNPIC